ncbi:helix-turn-helix domain-containing protein, partial [Congregibacter sp.]|uniref:helix-turn-helix domain-containing protein n=1 Tax=Congregibacter sp. TaxID=2744308 RepID=UPI003F6B193F
DLRSMADTQTFRADLLDRLSFDVVHMPALRHREEDVMLLARQFAVQMSAELSWEKFPGFAPAAILQLEGYHWPGNVRELKNVVERSLHRWADQDSPVETLVLDPFQSPWSDAALTNQNPATLPADEQPQASNTLPKSRVADKSITVGLNLRDSVERYEKMLLSKALEDHSYNQRRTAEALELSYDQLRGLVRKHELRTRQK